MVGKVDYVISVFIRINGGIKKSDKSLTNLVGCLGG